MYVSYFLDLGRMLMNLQLWLVSNRSLSSSSWSNDCSERLDITIRQDIDLFEIMYAYRLYNVCISLQEGKKHNK